MTLNMKTSCINFTYEFFTCLNGPKTILYFFGYKTDFFPSKTIGQGPIALAVGVGGGGLDIFTLIYPFSSFSLPLGDGPI